MERKGWLFYYDKFLKNVARQLAILQIESDFATQWPVPAKIFMKCLGEEFICKCIDILINKDKKLLDLHSNFIAQFLHPLLEKELVLKNFTKEEIKGASKNLFLLLSKKRKDPGCSNFLNIRRDAELSQLDTVRSWWSKDYGPIVCLVESLSELCSPVYRGFAFETHGPYGSLLFREYFIDFYPLEKAKLNITIIEKISSPPKVDLFGHLIKSERVVKYATLANGHQTEPEKLKEILISKAGIRKAFPTQLNELTLLCCNLIGGKLSKIGRIKISKFSELDEEGLRNFLKDVRRKKKMDLKEWEKMIYNKTLLHLRGKMR